MMPLKPTVILQRAPELNIQIYSNDHARILMDGHSVECGLHALAVLDAFSKPAALGEVLSKLQLHIRGAQDWVDLTSTIVQLHEAGVLRDPTQAAPVFRPAGSGFDAAPIHIEMLNDRTRTASYLSAIQEVVRPGDVVVDIGTGTGVLAVAAARAGARHVYAIEASEIGKAAEAVFKTNGLEERITLIPGWSTRVTLPERADVLVSEILGNEPLGEQVLEITSDALKRLLKPNARLIPGKVSLYGVPVVVPQPVLAKHRFTKDAQENWLSWYGIDFGPLSGIDRHSSAYRFFIKPWKARSWTLLSEPVLLAEIDLKRVTHPRIEQTVTTLACTAGSLNGLLMYFKAQLSPDIWLTTHPARVDEHCSWANPVWLFDKPLAVQPGDCLCITYTHRTSRLHSSISVSRA